MLRKLVGCLLIIGMIAASSLTAFAAPLESTDKSTSQSAIDTKDTTNKSDYKALLNSVIKDGKPDTTDEFLATITKPSSAEEKVTYRSYTIGGTTKKSDIKVFFARYNEETGKYQLVANANGDTSWESNSQFFYHDVTLQDGINKFKVVAYKTTQEDDLQLEDIQVTTFTITYMERSALEKALDFITNVLSPKSK